MTSDWPHQRFAVSEGNRLIDAGVKRFCITSPTGGGKSRIIQRLIERGDRILILTNRSMLFEQWGRGLDVAGHAFETRASGYATTDFSNVIIGMVQTIARRWQRRVQDLPAGRHRNPR